MSAPCHGLSIHKPLARALHGCASCLGGLGSAVPWKKRNQLWWTIASVCSYTNLDALTGCLGSPCRGSGNAERAGSRAGPSSHLPSCPVQCLACGWYLGNAKPMCGHTVTKSEGGGQQGLVTFPMCQALFWVLKTQSIVAPSPHIIVMISLGFWKRRFSSCGRAFACAISSF